MKEHQYVRYSEAFKQEAVREMESGRHRSVHAVAKAFGIRGSRTLSRWLREYGRSDLLPRKITISTMQEQDEKKALKERVRQLEKALSDAHMSRLLEKAYLEIACEDMGLDVSVFKKKHATGLLTGQVPKPEKSAE
jgi:transposase-like protein